MAHHNLAPGKCSACSGIVGFGSDCTQVGSQLVLGCNLDSLEAVPHSSGSMEVAPRSCSRSGCIAAAGCTAPLGSSDASLDLGYIAAAEEEVCSD